MAWTSADQNPSTSPSSAYGQTNYAAQLNNAAYYNPLGGGSSNTGIAPATTAAPGGTNYADRLNAAAPREPWETRETSRELATSADRTAAARRYTKEVSTKRGNTARVQGDRAYDLLHPQYVQRFALAARQARAEGIPVGIYSAYRPPGMGVGGFKDKYKSTHAYGIGSDVSGIGPAGSDTAKRWYEIATEYGLVNPYGPSNRNEWNHYQLVPEKSARQIPGLVDTITANGPIDVEQMWAASGVDPEGVPYSGGLAGGQGQTVMAGGTVPQPRMRPDRSGASMAYAPAPEAMDAAPFDAVLATSANRRPQPPTPQANPRRDRLQAPQPQTGAYTVQRGDNLTRISRQFGVPVQEIARANGIRNPDMIREGQSLVIPGQSAAPAPRQPASVPQPRQRPAREVAMPTPPARPDIGMERRQGGAPSAGNVPQPRMRPQPAAPGPTADQIDEMTRVDENGNYVNPQGGPLAQEPTVPWLERQFVNGKARPGPVIPRTDLETAQLNYRRPDFSLVAGGDLGTPETQMSIDRPPARVPAGPGMDTSGLIREPTAEERALQGQPMRLPTRAQPMDPAVQRQINRTPVVITDPQGGGAVRGARGVADLRGGAAGDRLGSGQRYFVSGEWQSADDLARKVNDAYQQWEGRDATQEEINRLVGRTIQNYNEGGNAWDSPDVTEGPDAPPREIPMSSLPQGPPSFVAGNGVRIWIG